MKKEIKTLADMTPREALNLFDDKFNGAENAFYSITIRETYGLALQGYASEENVRVMTEFGFKLKLKDGYLKDTIGLVDVTLTFQ